MRIAGMTAAAAVLLAGCGTGDEGSTPAAGNDAAAAPSAAANAARESGGPTGPAAPARGWELQSSGEGVALVLAGADGGGARIRLFCTAGADRLLVNVPGFRAIASEERLSFGSGGEATALVADPRGDAQRGGVSGAGAVPDDLAALVGGPVSASYGAQRSGPHPAPPANLARAFVAACSDGSADSAAPPTPPAASAGACHMQGGRRLDVAPLRAIGTEPFWGARIDGRCVTYSHPDDQQGTRVWTRYSPGSGGGGTWSGALGGRPFELRIRPQPGCSDGMSDTRYPLAAELLVNGEQRQGCAVPR